MYYYGIDYDDSYLTHYGVLGMKWGVRRANKLREKAKRTTDKKKKAIYNAKANMITAKGRALVGDKAYDYTMNDPTSKSWRKVALMGSNGARVYNAARAKGKSRLAAYTSFGTNGVLQVLDAPSANPNEYQRYQKAKTKYKTLKAK